MRSQPLWDWINERHAIYLRREWMEGRLPHPTKAQRKALEWRCRLSGLTDDPILHRYRFTNVFRELDRVTQWIHHKIRLPYAEHPHLWFMLAVARVFNLPSTLQGFMDLGAWPSEGVWNTRRAEQLLAAWQDAGVTRYTGAYMVRAPSSTEKYGTGKRGKDRYIVRVVLGHLWERRADWDTCPPTTIQDTCRWFRSFFGWGAFMAYEVATDLTHTRHLRNAPDLNTWANAGPGAKRGLNRLWGRPLTAPLPEEQSLQEMRDLLALANRKSAPVLAPWVPRPLVLRDIEHSLCETDKYLRVKHHEGRPRSTFTPNPLSIQEELGLPCI